MKTLTPEITAKLERLDNGFPVDATLSNGVLRSSKEIYRVTDEHGENVQYHCYHGIDGTITCFTRDGIIEVFEGKRDIWEGDIDDLNPTD